MRQDESMAEQLSRVLEERDALLAAALAAAKEAVTQVFIATSLYNQMLTESRSDKEIVDALDAVLDNAGAATERLEKAIALCEGSKP